MDDLLSEFLTETTESLDVVDCELVKFEQEPNNAEILDNIFRLVHTIKGTCGFLGLPRLEALAHAAETLMGKFRDGAPVTQEAVTLILASLDRIKELLADLEENEEEPTGDDNDLIEQLDTLAGVGAGYKGEENSSNSEDISVEEKTETEETQILTRELKPGEVSLEDLEKAFQEAEGPDDDEQPKANQEENKTTETKVAAKTEVATTGNDKDATGGDKKEKSVKSQSIRVNVDTLESLMTMVSELVLTRNQLLEMVRRIQDSEFKVPLQRLSNVTAELQEGVMKTRMQPIGNAWQKLPRIVRDLANELDKKIQLEMSGAETELDRQVLELIKDPLTHMVRNSADHGLESTEERLEAGKSETGRIMLSAYHEGGHIIIEIADDGKGLDAERIKAKAIENGLTTEAEAEKMAPAQIHKFIFKAGFSTAQKVTSVSGRGVGMDVVRSNIELIGGSVDLKSTYGQGTTFYIKIPLTLAIVSALIVAAGGHRFAVPQLNVIELVRVQPGSDHKIEMINDTPVLRLRNTLLPLVHLSKLLQINKNDKPRFKINPKNNKNTKETAKKIAKISSSINDNNSGKNIKEEQNLGAETTEQDNNLPEIVEENKEIGKQLANANDDETGFIIVTQVGTQSFGIVVDSVFDTEEIVVKPMSSMLRDISMFSGNTILGDGSVIMIVDPNGIAQTIHANNPSDATISEGSEDGTTLDTASKPISLLIFKAGTDEPKAVPLSLVTRLEEINVEHIEPSNGRDLVQYRGKLMPLVYIDEHKKRKEKGLQPVLVFTDEEHTMGLVVDEIVDIVEEVLDVEINSDRSGTVGSAVIRDKATEIIDVGYYLPKAFDNWFEKQETRADKITKKLLLIDDSAFFRNMLTPVLSAAGFRVTTVENAVEALSLRDEGLVFDIIVSDIEMPEMDGIEFAHAVKHSSKWANTPIIALSSHGSQAMIERAHDAGFVDYVAKFDREGLVTVLKELIDPSGEAAA